MNQDQIPQPLSTVVGHIAGVCAVLLAALTLWALYGLVLRPSLPLFLLTAGLMLLCYLMARPAFLLTAKNPGTRTLLPKIAYLILAGAFGTGAIMLSILIVFSIATGKTTIAELYWPRQIPALFSMAYLSWMSWKAYRGK